MRIERIDANIGRDDMGRDIGFLIEARDAAGAYRALLPSFGEQLHVHSLTINATAIPFAYSTERRSEIFFILEGFEMEDDGMEDEEWTRLAGGRGVPIDASQEAKDAIHASSDPGYGQPGWASADDFAAFDFARGYRIGDKREAYSEHAVHWLREMEEMLAKLGNDARLLFWWF